MKPAHDAGAPPEHPLDGLLHDQRRARRPETRVALTRSTDDRRLAGVCGGIAAYIDAPPGVVRAIFAISLIPSIGVTGLAYLMLWWLLPMAPPR